MKKAIVIPFALVVLLFALASISPVQASSDYDLSLQSISNQLKRMKLASSAFKHDSVIPEEYTCDTDDISPQLKWSNVPAKTKSFVLIVDDPDAYGVTWAHWVLYNIPAKTSSLRKGVRSQQLPAGTMEGLNDWGMTGYRGPCPPSGCHRYFFKIYALDTRLPNLNMPNKETVEKAMKGHILGQAQLMGHYSRYGDCY